MVMKLCCHFAYEQLREFNEGINDPAIEDLGALCNIVGNVASKILRFFFPPPRPVELTNFGNPILERGFKKYDGFGVDYDDDEPMSCELEGRKFENITFTAVNGANVTWHSALFNAHYFSEVLLAEDLLKTRLVFIINPTLGAIKDLYRYAIETFKRMITPASIKLRDQWEERLAENPNEHIIHICHSEGAAITRNALLITNPELREKIHIIAIAPGCFIDKELCGEVKHLVSIGDCVPYFDLQGMISNRDTIEYLIPKDVKLDHFIYESVPGDSNKTFIEKALSYMKQVFFPKVIQLSEQAENTYTAKIKEIVQIYKTNIANQTN